MRNKIVETHDDDLGYQSPRFKLYMTMTNISQLDDDKKGFGGGHLVSSYNKFQICDIMTKTTQLDDDGEKDIFEMMIFMRAKLMMMVKRIGKIGK